MDFKYLANANVKEDVAPFLKNDAVLEIWGKAYKNRAKSIVFNYILF